MSAAARVDRCGHASARSPQGRARPPVHGDATRGRRWIPSARLRHAVVLVAAAVFAAAACGDTDISSAPPDAGEVDVGALPRPPADDLPRPDPSDRDDPSASGTVPDETVTDTAPDTAPDTAQTAGSSTTSTGQLLDAEDPLCVAWAQVSRTREVLTMAATFGRLTDLQLARLELIAAPLVTDAVQRLDSALEAHGAVVGNERSVVRRELLGRFEMRARAAVAVLGEFSPSPDLPVLLAQVWLDGVRDIDPDATVPELADLGPEFGPVVDRAAAVFADDAGRWDDDAGLDPELVDEVDVPATVELVRSTCPDIGDVRAIGAIGSSD